MKLYNLRLKPSKIITTTFLILLVCFTALPLVYMVVTAFKPLDELCLYPPRFFVKHPVLTNFQQLFASFSSEDVPFVRYVFNSLMVTFCTVLGTVIVSSMGAYGLVKHSPSGSNMIMKIVIALLMFSTQVTMIPSYTVVDKLNMIDTYWALIIPKIAVAFNFFLMVQFVGQVPNALIEAAKVDGAGELKTYWSIVMPAVKPAWATLIVFSFISAWNDYFTPLIFTSSQAMKTIPLALQTLAGGPGVATLSSAGVVAAATFILTVPTIILFTLMQKKVIETMTYSGIKA